MPATVNFDRGLAEAIASEGTSRGNSPANLLGQGQTFDQMDPALRQLMAEKAATVTGDRSMLASQDAQDFIKYGRRQTTPAVTTPSLSTRSTAVTPSTSVATTSTPLTTTTSTPSTSTDYASLLDQINRYGTSDTTATTTPDYYAEELARQQAMIDAINARYATLSADTKQGGVEQMARARALANTSGALYSPRTDAQYAGVNEDTARALAALEAQKGQEMAAVYGKANDTALARAQAAAQTAATASQNRIQNLLAAYGLIQSDKAQSANLALAEAGLTGNYAGAPTLEWLNYQQGLKDQEFNQYIQRENLGLSQDQLALQREQFLQPNYDFVQLADGTYGRYNPVTGQFESQGRVATSSGGSGSGSSSGANLSGASLQALTDYYQRFGKYPTDAGDINTVDTLNQALQARYAAEKAVPVGPANPNIPNLFEYYYPTENTSGSNLEDLLANL